MKFPDYTTLPLEPSAMSGGDAKRWKAAAKAEDPSPGALADWMTVEQIPVAETRNYVKRVLKTYAAYQYVYGRGARGATLNQLLVAAK